MSEELVKISPHLFDKILELLVGDSEFRDSFTHNPCAAVKDRGISLTLEEEGALGQLASLCRKDGPTNFDDRLVLCSSSGY